MNRVTLLALVLAGLLLRLAFLSQPMRLDESANYVFLASKSFYTCATVHLDGNNHPLHTLLVHLSSLCFGTAPWCLRMPSFVAGVLLVPATARAMKEIFDGPTGLLAGALVVPSAPLLEYATNARGYSVQTLLFVLLLLSAAKVLRGGTLAAWAAVGIFAALMLYTIPSSIYYAVAIGAWLVLSAALGDVRAPRRRFLARLGVTGAGVAVAVFLLYLPFVRTAGLAAMTQNRWVRSLSWGELRGGLGGRLWEYAVFVHRGLPLVVAGVPGALVLGNGAAYQNDDQVTFRDAEPMTLALSEILRKGDVVYVQKDASVVVQYYFALHHVPLDYLYPAGTRAPGGRAFVIDASKDYRDFTYQLALSDSDLQTSKDRDFALAPILEQPYATLYRLLTP